MKHKYRNGHDGPGRNRGGQCHKANPDGSGGRSKAGIGDANVEHGLSMKSPITETPGELGMSTKGMSEKPQAIAKGEVSTDRGKFHWK